MKKKKIVVTGTRGVPNIMGGVETHCEELFPRLVEMGYDVTILRRDNYVTELSDAEVKDGQWKGVKLVDVPSPKKKSFEAIVHTIRAINKAKELGADIVHIHAIGPALVAPYAKMRGLKVVFTHHGPDYDRDKWGFAAKTMLKMGETLGCKFADHVIVISDVIKNLIGRRCGRTKNVSLIYNGVPSPELCHEPEYFKELGIEEGKYILGMCRFVPEKHLHDLVAAFVKMKEKYAEEEKTKTIKTPEGSAPVSESENSSKLDSSATRPSADSIAVSVDPSGKKQEKPSFDDIKLVLAGDTDFEDDYSRGLKKMARENGVVLTGFVRGTKLHSLLTNAMCYSLPSSHEGLPIALLEAMSYRLPVITSAIPANLEVGLDPERYHEVGDVDALAEKLEAICSRPLERIKYDMGKYDWDRIAKQVSKIYDSL